MSHPLSSHPARVSCVAYFLQSASELRIKILGQALVSPSDIRPILSEVSMHRGSLFLIRPTLNLPENRFVKIFLLSKQFQAEAEPIAYGQNTFKFINAADIYSFPLLASNPKTPARRRIRKCIKKIELTLDGSMSSPITNRIMALISPPELLHKVNIGRKELERMKRTFEALPSLENLTVHATMWPADEVPVSIFVLNAFLMGLLLILFGLVHSPPGASWSSVHPAGKVSL